MIFKTIIDKYRFFKATGQQIERLQLNKINHLFYTARKYSKYYRQIFDKSGINSIKSFEDFEKLPLLKRADLKKHLEDIKIEKFTGYDVKTSGSSGEPVTISKSRKSIIRTLISGHPFFISKYTKLKIKKVCLILVWGDNSVEDIFEDNIVKYLNLSKTRLSVLMPINEIVNVLVREKPELILTYPSFLLNLRQYLHERNIRLDFLKLVIISGELITSYFIEKNQSFYNCPILNAYISTEGGFMAIDLMERSGMYLLADNIYLEVVKNGKPVIDEEGDIVMTELNNFATPLIRYRGLGDRGIISIDSGKRYLKLISGRRINDIINRYNTRICAYAITEIIESYKEALKFKIIQKSPENIKILISISNNRELFCEEAKYYSEIKTKIEEILKHSIKLEIEIVDNMNNMVEDMPFQIVERKF